MSRTRDRAAFALTPAPRTIGRHDPKHSGRLLACLAAVYLIWGSSFLFTKLGVTHLPGTLFSGVRFATAGLLLSGFAFLFAGQDCPSSGKEWVYILVMGLLTVPISNGLNIWAIHFMSSSESALLNSTAALWIAGLGVFGARGHRLTPRVSAGVLLGVLGTALTVLPRLSTVPGRFIPFLGPLAASFAWALATIYYRNTDTRLGALMFIGLQMLTGGLMQLALGLALGQSREWEFNATGAMSLAYLTIFSSCFAYTAYGWLTRHTTPAIIGTYSYVNPAIAAFLGSAFLGEHLLRLQFIGMGVILIGVVLVTLPGSQVSDPKTLEEPASQ
jgi:drug/metabolite transporter (DMT)-like permease